MRRQRLHHVTEVNVENAADEQNVHEVVESMGSRLTQHPRPSVKHNPIGYNAPAKAGLQL